VPCGTAASCMKKETRRDRCNQKMKKIQSNTMPCKAGSLQKRKRCELVENAPFAKSGGAPPTNSGKERLKQKEPKANEREKSGAIADSLLRKGKG